MSYQDRILEHLSRYKEETLGISELGVFMYREREIRHRHILPLAHKWLNVLEPIRERVQAHLTSRPGITPHRYFHHLNSSQAFALNLFFPYLNGGPETSCVLLRALGQSGTVASGQWRFEDTPDEEERSNIDVTWTTSDGLRTLCEVKLTETSFGTATDDPRHLAKLRDTYEPRLRGVVDDELLAPTTFFLNYQVLRNIWHLAASKASRLIFVLPRANTHAWDAISGVLPQVRTPWNTQISVVSVEDVIAALCSDPTDGLRDHAERLKAKYIPARIVTPST